jgi:dTDP-glucose pyrophosphorylase
MINNKVVEILIHPTTTILKAIEVIEKSALQVAVVVDSEKHILGLVTDGDIRRGILGNISLEAPVEKVMNRTPVIARQDQSSDDILEIMRSNRFHHIPVVDGSNCLVGLVTIDDLIKSGSRARDNWVVLMAGGLGTRLRPLTEECPKPLLKIGNRPILETILLNFKEHGFRRFYLTVNYMADMIKEYFGNGSKWGVEIRYIQENIRMGTAGALSLLPEKPESAVFVMNGDLLTNVNFGSMLDFHLEHEAYATMCVREYDYQVPYGVVNVDQHHLKSIVEKPLQHFFVNAGIYILNPNALDYIPENSFFDMPELFERLVRENAETIVFPIREYWLDIGRMEDYDRANGEYSTHFVAN